MSESELRRGDVRVVVGILTFKRPNDLAVSLPKILAQTALLLQTDEHVISADILVVDNDPERSAESIVATFQNVQYVAEPVPGIAAARNRALDEARPAELLVFIDDDEEPDEHWIVPLVTTWRDFGAAAVMGRVQSHLPEGTDPWVAMGGFFFRPERPTGTQIPIAAAGNLLLDLAQIATLDVRFDTHLGLGGGEDSLFSKYLVQRGGRIVWCNESLTHDFVSPDRTTRKWAMKRAWSHGNTRITIERRFAKRPIDRARIRVGAIIGGLARAGVGAVRAGMGVVIGSMYHRVKGVRLMCKGGGMFVGAFGVVVQEYARDDSRAVR